MPLTYDEMTDGALSSDRTAPTQLTLEVGENTVSASQGGSGSNVDYFTIIVPEGTQLTSLVANGYKCG